MTTKTEEPAKGLLDAVLAVQTSAPKLKKTAENPHFRSKFVPLDTIVETVGPLLSSNGLVWLTFPGRDEDGEPVLAYRLVHVASGEALEGRMPLLLVKRDPQGQGSAITYARRYALTAVLNLVADDDDDGNSASAKPAAQKVAPERADLTEIKTLVRRNKVKTEELRTMLRGAGLTFEPKANPAVLLPQLTPEQAALVTQFLQAPIPEGTSDVPSDASEFEHEKDAGPPLFDPSVPA